MRAAALALIALAAILAPFLALPAGALAISAQITGPTALAPSQLAAYNVTVIGVAPGTAVTYTVTYTLSGANLTGGSPAANAPGRTTSTTSPIRINVTAPASEQTILLDVQVSAKLPTETQNTSAELSITVLKPITLTAQFHNGSATAALNVTVRFFVDNVFVGQTVIKHISANGDNTATLTYPPVGLQPGEHTVSAQADLNGDGIIEPAQGETVTYTIFYDQVPTQSLGWSLLLGIAVAVPAFLAVALVRRRYGK